ncbi:hypothetical protein [Intestinibacter bartlettii]|uniref:hypothetical protein n=1 Tax=Intestinibacter bartlettii TaxID=261299 RepID=UPI0026749733|nr:hypothetical protein [Intestinibacter bartlettii]
MSFTGIIFIMALILIIGVVIGFLIKSKSISLICAVLTILIVLVWFLVASGILTNCG